MSKEYFGVRKLAGVAVVRGDNVVISARLKETRKSNQLISTGSTKPVEKRMTKDRNPCIIF
jgi:hypothetical protein